MQREGPTATEVQGRLLSPLERLRHPLPPPPAAAAAPDEVARLKKENAELQLAKMKYATEFASLHEEHERLLKRVEAYTV